MNKKNAIQINGKRKDKRFKAKKMRYIILTFIFVLSCWGKAFGAGVTDWWDSDWSYRKVISCGTSHDAYTTNHFLKITGVSTTGDKFLDSGDDIRIIYQTAAGQTDLGRYLIDINSASTDIYFKVQADIPANENIGGESDYKYYMYYGNSGAGSPPTYTNTECIDAPYSVDDNTVALYHLEEQSDHYLDETSYNNDSDNETVTARDSTGKFGYCPDFDGNDDMITIADHPSLDYTALTLEAWCNISNIPSSGATVIAKDDGTTREYNIHIITPALGEHAKAYLGGSTETGSSDVVDGNWHHIAGVWDGSALSIYVDGSQESAPGTSYSGSPNKAVNLFIGARGGVANTFSDGVIDEVRISDIARTNFYHVTTEATLSSGSEETIITEYYVRKSGSDDSSGASPSTAWLTIPYAVSQMGSGDTLWIGAGDYSTEAIIVTDKNYADWTCFFGDYDGSQTGDSGEVKIDYLCANTDWGKVHIDHLRFKGTATCVWTGGVSFFNDADGRIKITHCVIDSATTLYLGAYLEFTNNYVKDNGGQGFYGSALISHFDTGYVYNNTIGFTTNHYAGIEFALYMRGASGDHFWIKNNLFPSDNGDVDDGYIGLENYTLGIYEECDNNYFKSGYAGNLNFRKTTSWLGSADLAAWNTATSFDAVSQVGDPYLETDGYHLTDSSACIDTGYDASAVVSDDIDGDSRPQNSVFDVGCDEYPADTSPPDTVTGVDTTAVGAHSVDLFWDQNASSDCAGYQIRYNSGSTPPDSVTQGTFGDSTSAIDDTAATVSGLCPSTQYSFSVFAKDEVPNWTVKGSDSWITVTTDAASACTVYVVADSTPQDWDADPVDSTCHYCLVDDPAGSPDAGVTEITSNVDAEFDWFVCDTVGINCIPDARVIDSVVVKKETVCNGIGVAGSTYTYLKDASDSVNSGSNGLSCGTPSYTSHSWSRTTHPDGSAWTKTNLKSTLLGIKSTISGAATVKCDQIYYVVYHSAVSVGISLSDSTWNLDTLDASEVKTMASGERIFVKNTGNVMEQLSLKIDTMDTKGEWSCSNSESGQAENVYVMSGFFYDPISTLIQGSWFNEGNSEDVIDTLTQWASDDTFCLNFGPNYGDSVAVGDSVALWLQMKMPTTASGPKSDSTRNIIIEIGCRQEP